MSTTALRSAVAPARRLTLNRLAALSHATPTSTRLSQSAALGLAAHRRPLSTLAVPSSSHSSSPPPRSSHSLTLAALAAAIGAIAVGVYQSSPALAVDATPAQPDAVGTPGLDPKNFTPLKLKSVTPYNHNSAIYTFALPDPNAYLNLPVSSCVMMRYKNEGDGKDVVRPYTPIDTHRKGEAVFLIKAYPTGKMSQHLTQLKPGDTLDFKGPMPKLKYEANMKRKIGMIAGGTGITPMLQVLEEVANNPDDKSEVHLVFANVSGKDVLMKETLDALVQKHPNIKVTYVIDSKDKDWTGEVGRIDKDLIKRVVPFSPKDGKDVMMYVCGPPSMMKAISGDKAKDYSQGEVDGALKELGFTKDQVYKF